MIHDPAIAHVLRPLSEQLLPTIQQQGQKILEALDGLDAKDQLN